MARVADAVMQILSAHTGVDVSELSGDTRLVEDLGLDSIDAIELLVTVERETGLMFDVDDATEIETINDVVVFLRRPADTG